MLKEFKEFIAKGNAIDFAVGVVIGAAFGAIVTSLVMDVILPVVGLLLGGVDFANKFIVLKGDSFPTLAAAQEAGSVTLNYGLFINAIVSFTIIAFVIFLVVKGVNKMRPPAEPEPEAPTKDCPHCLTAVPAAATRCPACTSEL
jgi:large conductance mechanosensitive channel